MTRFKLWLILFSIALIVLDKFSFISRVRDYSAIYIQNQVSLLIYRLKSYPKLVLLQKSEQQQLQKENIQLKKQVEQYAILLKQQNNQGIDAKELEALKAQPGLYDNFHVTVARAIIDVNYLVNNKLLIDKGSNTNITDGNAVVNKDGVVGQIGITNSENSQIILVTNPDYKIYLQSSISKTKMLAQGIGNNNLLVKYISKNEKITSGDILVTTGLDDIYPANIPVARVIKVFYENNGFNSALCEPVINFNKLQYVLVLKNAN
jgi:rod shape-determining protein MreC